MLEVNNLTVGYGKETVLDGVSTVFEPGKLTGIIGVNGCGKSTLLKSLIGELPITNGSIKIDSAEISGLKRNEIAKRIAYLSQGKNTPDMTVLQMVLHGRFPYLSYPRRYTSYDKEIAYSSMERLGIAELAEKSVCSLSGGMRQYAYIAMALAQNTDYILLDEPTTYLDIGHQIELMRILQELAREGKGVVAVMHDLPMAFEFSDVIAVLSSKKIIALDTPLNISNSQAIKETFGVGIQNSTDNKFLYSY
jgi:iron complex transport system ATP-binding protein